MSHHSSLLAIKTMASYNSIILLLAIVFLCIGQPSDGAKRRRQSMRKRDSGESTLELVHVLFRHGDRTPDRDLIYPTDPHINHTYHPIGFGQLTNAGKRKEYLLGKALYKRYGKFLGTYNIETVDARATDYNRTKMSLQLVLASLFPPKDDLVWEKHLKWQPVPFNYWPINNDHVLGNTYKNCPKFRKLYDNFVESIQGHEHYANIKTTADYISRHAGINMTSKSLVDMYFTLTTEAENGLKLPEWTRAFHPNLTDDFVIADYNSATASDEMKKLASGFLFKKIIEDSRAKMQAKLPAERKMFLYSAHEINLALALKYLGIYYPHVPPYGSYVLIEIHNVQNGIRGVKVFYQDYQTVKPRRLKLPNCELFCRFDKFVKLYSHLLPTNARDCSLV